VIPFAFNAGIFFFQEPIVAQDPQMILDCFVVPLKFVAGEALSQQFPAEYLPNFGVYRKLRE
jgi:hypothetical protein